MLSNVTVRSSSLLSLMLSNSSSDVLRIDSISSLIASNSPVCDKLSGSPAFFSDSNSAR